jgi:Family of unknown function (DUF6338)
VIPTTAFGVVVVAAALGPGYVFVRVEERRRPRAVRSPLLETAELLLIGGLASTAAFSGVAALAASAGWIDEHKLALQRSAYVLEHLSLFAGLLLLALVISYLATWVAARILFLRRPRTIEWHSAWDEILRPRSGITNYVTAGLDDSTAVAGDVLGYTAGSTHVDERELIIANPEVRARGQQSFLQAREQFVVLRGDRINTLSVIHWETVQRAAPPNWLQRQKAKLHRMWTARRRSSSPGGAAEGEAPSGV